MRKFTQSPEAGQSIAVPAGLYGPYLPVTTHEVDCFNDWLPEELDSSFGSSIRCCDRCFDDFETLWPATALRNELFWSGCTSVETIFEQSRLADLYNDAEISTLRRFVVCPRCGQYSRDELWLHEDYAAAKFEQDIARIASVARRTPFLLLNDGFCRTLLDLVRKLGRSAVPEHLPRPLFRARSRSAFGTADPYRLPLADFGPPPAELVGEGRFNHAGLPMLYLADGAETALLEVGRVAEEICLATLAIAGDYKVLDLVSVDPDEEERELLAAVSASALVGAPRTGSGWVKKEYAFTRFIADCALDSGFDFIRYGSTRSVTGSNYVMLSPPAALSPIVSLESLAVCSLAIATPGF